MSQTPHDERINGIFSQKKTVKIGTGTTARKTEQISYYYVAEQDNAELVVQPLTADGKPFGPKGTITREELLSTYMPEPQMSLAKPEQELTPKEQEVQRAVARGDKFRKRGETFTAEFEYGKALQLDERNVRANFGIGLCYIDRGEREKAHEVFERLVHLDAAFEHEHKHLFNEFGIALRKSGMHAESIGYYQRALELSPEDENLHYNTARAAFDKGDPKLAAQHLGACLRLNPTHEEATQFITFLKRKKLADA
jgi:tetratricopeptide (TPR) repeat protein